MIKPEDTVYCLGDFALTSRERIEYLLSILNGKKILIVGNHDKDPETMKELGFDEAYIGPIAVNSCMLSHYPIYQKGKFTLNVSVDNFNFSPIPFKNFRNIIICGHNHNNWILRYGYEDEQAWNNK